MADLSNYLVKAKVIYNRALTEEDFPTARDAARAFIKNIDIDELNGGDQPDPNDIIVREVEMIGVKALMTFSVNVTQNVRARDIMSATKDFYDMFHECELDIMQDVPNVKMESVEVVSVERMY